MKKIFQIITLTTTLAIAATSLAFELEHTTGTIKGEQTPERIVSYDLSILDSLNALGIEAVGVPQSSYKDELAKFAEAPKVGTLFEPDYEALKALKPELIFAGGRSASAIPALEKIAPVANLTNRNPEFLADFRTNTLRLAAAFDKTKEAEEGLANIDKDIADLQKLNIGKTGAFLFVMNGNIIPHVVGDRFGFVYELTGLESVLPAKTAEELAVPAARPAPDSPEAKAAAEKRAQQIKAIAKADPDWLIVFDRAAINGGENAGEKTLAEHPDLSQTSAFKNGRVVYVDPVRWYIITGGLNNLKFLTGDFLNKMK
ncbi:Petrobactin-binding protein YclQ [Oligella urethralis]|uniref:ABC transporter substrate-binding protein n=1 Tax=Oligella urethralis TaxID=90245 RepID=UPI0029588CB3|nr:ABC transporter substrate-binding protein [Oligella urethralis]WOS37162.1 Petrobactin-binding protein YclQ [Oligella urethralis]